MTAYIVAAACVDKRAEGFIEYSGRAGELTSRCGSERGGRCPAETVLADGMWDQRPWQHSR